MYGALFEMLFAPDSEPDACSFRSWRSRLAGKSGDSFARKSFETLDCGVRIIVRICSIGNRPARSRLRRISHVPVDQRWAIFRTRGFFDASRSFRKIEVMSTFGYWSIVSASAHHRPLAVSSAGGDVNFPNSNLTGEN